MYAHVYTCTSKSKGIIEGDGSDGAREGERGRERGREGGRESDRQCTNVVEVGPPCISPGKRLSLGTARLVCGQYERRCGQTSLV